MVKFHPSLKKIFKEVDSWINKADQNDDMKINEKKIYDSLAEQSLYNRGAGLVGIHNLGNYFANLACCKIFSNDIEDFYHTLNWAVAFRSLSFRFDAAVPSKREGMLPLAFSSAMKATGPAILSQWREAELAMRSILEVAEKNLRRFEDKDRRDDWGKNTMPAFLIGLFCQAFKLETFYYPVNPMIPEYQALLDHWQTKDDVLYRQIMQAAAEFHISRSKNSTSKINYEFDSFFDTVFPAELLTLQALRRRDGLPEFETGHLLIDTPWSVIRDLPEVEPHPLLAIVEARIKHDYPAFR